MWLPLTCPTEDVAYNPGMCPDWELNQQPFGSEAGTQSTQPHQPWLENKIFKLKEEGEREEKKKEDNNNSNNKNNGRRKRRS